MELVFSVLNLLLPLREPIDLRSLGLAIDILNFDLARELDFEDWLCIKALLLFCEGGSFMNWHFFRTADGRQLVQSLGEGLLLRISTSLFLEGAAFRLEDIGTTVLRLFCVE